MLKSRAEIARERRRMMQVRRAFVAGYAADDRAAPERREFGLACADYLAFSMGRLHEQDGRIHELLAARLPAADAAARASLGELGERLAESRRAVQALAAGAAELRRAGPEGLSAFDAVFARFDAASRAMLTARANPMSRHTDELFEARDWEHVAAVTGESLAREAGLFQAVQRTAPAGADPEAFSATHGAGTAGAARP